MEVLEIKDLKKDYKNFSLDLSFALHEGEILSILGPSGSGKTTLLNIISGQEEPSSGSVILQGEDITEKPIQKRDVGLVFQDYSLFSNMNVGKNIIYGMKEKKRKEKKAKLKELLELGGLEGYEKRKVTSLSGGEAQRIALLRSIAANPKLLLLDEPLSALDAPMRKRLRNEIIHIHQKTNLPILYITHDREEAFALSDRIILLRNGKIADQGKPEDLYKNPNSLFTAFFLGEGTALPASLFIQNGEGKLFFRPEDVAISELAINPDDYPNHLVINDAKVESAEFIGSGYNLGLSFMGYPILAYSVLKPRAKSVSLLILNEVIKNLKN